MEGTGVQGQHGRGLFCWGDCDREARIERVMLVTTPVVTAGWVCLIIYGLSEIASQLI
jgi:hypothetical protein